MQLMWKLGTQNCCLMEGCMIWANDQIIQFTMQSRNKAQRTQQQWCLMNALNFHQYITYLNIKMERKETQIIPGTDMNVVSEVQMQYYNVLKILIDPELQPLKSRITMLFNNLTEHLESEENHIRKCKMNKSDIDNFATRIVSCNKVIEEQTQQADNIKKDLQKLQIQTEELKKKEVDVKDMINRYKLQMNIIEKDCIKGLQEIEIKQENEENELKKKLDEQNKIRDQLQSKHVSLLNQQKFGIEEMSDLQSKQSEINKKISDLREKIKQIEDRDALEKKNNDEKKAQLNHAKIQKDALKEAKEQLQAKLEELDKEISQTAENVQTQKKNKDEQHRNKVKLEKQKQQFQKDKSRKAEEVQKFQSIMSERAAETKAKEEEYEQLIKTKLDVERQLEVAKNMRNQILNQNDQINQKKSQLLEVKTIEQEQLQKLISQRQKSKARINEFLSKKLEKDKQWKQSEVKQRQIEFLNLEEINKMKKISNEVTSYQIQQQKLSRILQQIKKEQEKYGIEASHAHSKYYQTLEELKIKNTQIQNLQRDNQEVQNKCKHQQNLYEAVRSDRNLYSKDFIKSKDQINELKKKYKRMTYAVEQLREEIKNKDQKLVQLDKDYKKVEGENVKIKAQKNRAKAQIQSNQQVIKNQENHINHMKKIIQTAKQQKAKQQKDYDMVRNERDILGTQLIKRNHQLSILYEKIKLSNSNLIKGNIYCQQKSKELTQHKLKLASLRNQYLSIDSQIRCIDELKAEISFKEKELLNQMAKVKALQDQLQNPMNVHRWRKLQATDQENYERILKIQTLQRRLIAKTEEVQAKQNLIRQKQKLFLELKNVLARQPGSEIHQQLIKYKEALKEKTGQMKKMKNQLQNAHQQMNRLKFEVDRIKNEMSKMKDQYFELREASEKQVLNERNLAQEMMDLQNNNKPPISDMNISTIKKP